MNLARRIFRLAAGLAALSSIASGYYHFVYFSGRGAPFTPIRLQFDLTKAAKNTILYFISDSGPNVFVPGDSFTGVISELQLAAQAWNGIPSSQLKLAYGGLENASTLQTAPGIDVVFDDNNIAPGILAQTKVSTYADVSFIVNNPTNFLPILRSRIQLRKNLTVTSPQQASFYDSSFTTMVHEFGHAIGLQHTLTSATMATYVTRSTTKATPLAVDDIAGVSLLYPAPGYLATTGSISGQVTLGGAGVNLASVVAISPANGAAVSSLTNPDGTYEIDALPVGNYLLYVHPLPPAAQGEAGPDAIVLPQDSAQQPFYAYTGFVTQFFPGTRDWTQAVPIGVSAANIVSGVNFNVQGSAGPVVYGMQLSGAPNGSVEASPMLPANGAFTLEFYAPGTVTASNQLVAGFNVSIIGMPGGNPAPASVVAGYTRFYTRYNGLPYVSMGIYTAPQVAATTPVALALTVNGDLYVLPAAFFVVPSGPPAIATLSQGSDANGNPTVTVAGPNVYAGTQIVFDGTPATPVGPNPDGSFTFLAPPAPASYSSSIEALNPDGQTSGQAIPTGVPPQYLYNYVNPALIQQINPSTLLTGTDAWVQIRGSDTNFSSQATVVGFGSSDIVVKQSFVVSPSVLWVNVSVNPLAQPTATTVTITTGLQTATFTLAIQVVAANANQISMRAPVVNAATGLAGTPLGGTAVITLSGLPASGLSLAGWGLTIGGQQATLPSFTTGTVSVVVPGGLTIGPAVAQMTPPAGTTVPAILMQIDAPPPVIGSVVDATGALVSSTQTVHLGDVLTLNMVGFGDGVTPVTAANIFVTVNGVNIPFLLINFSALQIQIPGSIATGAAVPVAVGIGTRVSAPVSLDIQN